MDSSSNEFDDLKENLQGKYRKKLKKYFNEEKPNKRELIKKNISRDRQHLKLVNICSDAFYYESKLRKKTGYIFRGVEPLYGKGIKNFDVAIYGNKVLILIECKSSISERNVRNTLREIEEKIDENERNVDLLEEILDVEIDIMEYALCSFAPVFARVNIKSQLKSMDLPVCLWYANKTGDSLWMEETSNNSEEEIKRGRLHKDKKLRKLLLEVVDLKNRSVRTAPFLPSSHSCTMLAGLSANLYTDMNEKDMENFTFEDIHLLISRLHPFKEFQNEQVSSLTKDIIDLGLSMGIFKDESPTVSNKKDKEYSMTCHYSEVEEKYIEKSAEKQAKEEAVEKFKSEQHTMEEYS